VSTKGQDNLDSSSALDDAFRSDVRRGLSSPAKWLLPKWNYDITGSALYQEIVTLPEYYPSRTEAEILADSSYEIARRAQPLNFVELGSGFSRNTRVLLDALSREGGVRTYTAVDLSASALHDTIAAIKGRWPSIDASGMLADFETSAALKYRSGDTLTALLGGTIGNLPPARRSNLLAKFRGSMHEGDHLLIGTDLLKSSDLLLAAYDDRAGVTARFNRNILQVINRRLGADFNPYSFEHVATWVPAASWIEMRLRSLTKQVVKIPALNMSVCFDEGEEILTEISAKFERQPLIDEFAKAGLTIGEWWEDRKGWFSLSMWSA
jgi:L-histidine Nalpha-methyltransferase